MYMYSALKIKEKNTVLFFFKLLKRKMVKDYEIKRKDDIEKKKGEEIVKNKIACRDERIFFLVHFFF